ncbi:tyrosine-type recombinase/integrase [Mycolicibacterium senegalense]|uniref:tyrosine-type recombinase/integrase n=1 Tax=Mycolicibacterium senegalense TaxID=1796 RepID=UPI00362BE628
MAVPRYRARPVKTSAGSTTWTVCDPRGIPCEDIDDFLHALRARPASVNTIKTYSEHLSALFTYLAIHHVPWDRVEHNDLSDFLVVYRSGVTPFEKRGGGVRGIPTLKGAAAAIRGFYDYQRIDRGRGPQHLRLTREVPAGSRGDPHRFLAHIEARKEKRLVNSLSHGMPPADPKIEIINFEDDFQLMLAACATKRDQLALSAYYDLGLRIGQTIGLKHADLDPRRKEVKVIRREDNPNGALSKRKGEFVVHAGMSRFFSIFRDYLLGEFIAANIDSDYVFINLSKGEIGRPVSYSNMYKQCEAIGMRAGLGPVNPHMLRHTHATALAKAGWTSAEIATRLGHRYSSSADVYIHLANSDLEKRLQETSHLVWPGVADVGNPT